MRAFHGQSVTDLSFYYYSLHVLHIVPVVTVVIHQIATVNTILQPLNATLLLYFICYCLKPQVSSTILIGLLVGWCCEVHGTFVMSCVPESNTLVVGVMYRYKTTHKWCDYILHEVNICQAGG